MNFESSRIFKGWIAGFAGTFILTLLMMIKAKMGVMPELDPIHMIANMIAKAMGHQPNVVIGWVMHFMIGSVAWGSSFAILNKLLPPKSQIIKGIMFGMIAWLIMMIVVMPMAGAGLFGLKIGTLVPILTCIFHIVFGAVLGAVFLALGGDKKFD